MLKLTIFLALPLTALCIPPLQIEDNRLNDHDSVLNEVASPFQVPRYRLPVAVTPLNYRIFIRPVLKPSDEFERFSAPGNVTISIKSSDQPFKSVTLHQKNLNIPLDQIKVSKADGASVALLAPTEDASKDFLTLNFQDEQPASAEFSIFIPFTADINRDKLYGLYLSSFMDPAAPNETRLLATTQFQPTYAREMFPCFDEPDMKATFEISVARLDPDFHTLSNTIVVRNETDTEHAGWVWDHYQKTAYMSTYLVAVIVSDFKAEPAPGTVYNKPVKVWGPGYLIDQDGGKWAAEASEKMIKYFQDFTQIEYALPKLDSVAIPQFSAGAMENWGLNTYRTEYLLHIPNENTESDRKKITQVLGHEITHQWFGNLVTCKWWTHTWLNEGFARFLQYRGMTAATTDFKTDIAIVSDSTQLGMIYDAGANTHPVLNDALSPEEVDNIFDRITYDKGASLLRMMESVLTTSVFDDSLRHYLAKTQNGTAVQDDLFESFQTVGGNRLGGFTAKQILDTWTTQSGYPIVKVSVVDSNKIYISQERFSNNQGQVADLGQPGTGSWIIPIRIVSAAAPDFTNKSPDVWIPQDVSLISYSSGIDTSKWIIVNPDLGGYYRVIYDTKLRSLIQQQLESDPEVISSGTRSQILEDYFQFAEQKLVQFETALQLTRYLAKEKELVVWAPLLTNIRKIYNKFTADSSAFDAFKKYFEPRIAGPLDLINWEQSGGEKGVNVILRAQLLDFACAFGASKCVEYSKRLFDAWATSPQNRSSIPADIRPIVFCSAVANGDNNLWQKAYVLWQTERFTTTKSQLLKSLACSKSEDTLNSYISYGSTGNNGLVLQTVLRDIAANSVGRDLVYNWMVSDDGKSKITPQDFASVVSTLADYSKDESFIEQIQKYIEEHEDDLPAEIKNSLASSINKAHNNILWWKNEGIYIQEWMETQ